MPQLQVRVPTLRRWGKKLAVALDRAFFDALGGPSDDPVQDLDEGEVLSLDESSRTLLATETVRQVKFEQVLQSCLHSRYRGFQMGFG